MSEEAERLRKFGVICGAAPEDTIRIALSDGGHAWGDHLRVEVMHEDDPGKWRFLHISADTAEALAAELTRRATYLRGR